MDKKKEKSKFIENIKLGLYFGLLIGSLVGIIRLYIFIQENNYISTNLKKIVYYLLQYYVEDISY